MSPYQLFIEVSKIKIPEEINKIISDKLDTMPEEERKRFITEYKRTIINHMRLIE